MGGWGSQAWGREPGTHPVCLLPYTARAFPTHAEAHSLVPSERTPFQTPPPAPHGCSVLLESGFSRGDAGLVPCLPSKTRGSPGEGPRVLRPDFPWPWLCRLLQLGPPMMGVSFHQGPPPTVPLRRGVPKERGCVSPGQGPLGIRVISSPPGSSLGVRNLFLLLHVEMPKDRRCISPCSLGVSGDEGCDLLSSGLP